MEKISRVRDTAVEVLNWLWFLVVCPRAAADSPFHAHSYRQSQPKADGSRIPSSETDHLSHVQNQSTPKPIPFSRCLTTMPGSGFARLLPFQYKIGFRDGCSLQNESSTTC